MKRVDLIWAISEETSLINLVTKRLGFISLKKDKYHFLCIPRSEFAKMKEGLDIYLLELQKQLTRKGQAGN